MTRLAIVVSHPIQYFSPWFAYLAQQEGLSIKVFYLWDFGTSVQVDQGFGISFKWDIPLLDGYSYEFVENKSNNPGTHHFRGLNNPKLTDRIADWSPDVILMFGYAYLSHLRLMYSPTLRHIPIILRGDSHNLGRPEGFKTKLGKILRQFLFIRLNAFLAVGQANQQYFLECAKTPNQIFMAPHFVDNERFQNMGIDCHEEALAWRRSLGIDDDAIVVGFIGKFESKKRPWDLLSAGKTVASRLHTIDTLKPKFIFVGAGDGTTSLQQQAAERINKDVFFAPFQNQSDMPRVYAALDILVLPSGFGETWGLCVNEAMNLGVPAIVSDVVGCGPDLVIPGKTGWTFPAGDIEGLSNALEAALSMTTEQRHAMSANVRQHIAEFSIANASKGLMQAIDAVLRSRKKHYVR